jgi:hypothetical protein
LTLKKTESMILIIIIIFLGLLIATHWVYAVRWEVIIQTMGSMFGVLIGSFLAGSYAVKSVRNQIDYDRKKEETKDKERLLKAFSLYKYDLKTLSLASGHLDFYVKEYETGLNIYEIDYEQEFNKSMERIIEIKNSLLNINLDFLTVEANDMIRDIIGSIRSLQLEVDAYLALGQDTEQTQIPYLVKKLHTKIDAFIDHIERQKSQ